MDVQFKPVQAVSPVKKYQGAQRASATAAYGGIQQASDKVDFSDSGKLFAQAMKQAMASREVREEKVAALRQSTQDGVYSPDSREIARKMLSSLGM